MTANDVSVRPVKQEIIIDESTVVNYGFTHDKSACDRVRRTQAYVLGSSSNPTVIWPSDYIEVDLPSDLDTECSDAIRPMNQRMKREVMKLSPLNLQRYPWYSLTIQKHLSCSLYPNFPPALSS